MHVCVVGSITASEGRNFFRATGVEGALELWPVLHDAHQQIEFAYLLIWLKVCKVFIILWCQFIV